MIIYLHGLNSAFDPTSDKVKLLSKIDEIHPLSYDSFDTFDNISKYLMENIRENAEELVFVGTSLGGFYSAHMASRLGLGSVIINPCYDPYEMLKGFVGQELENYKTNERRVFTQEALDSYEGQSIAHRKFKRLPLLLLDGGDESIDSDRTRTVLGRFDPIVFPGGNHRFAHMAEALPEIRKYFHYCSFAENVDFD
jgi:predicted esterase YcpF (UPF0227 family)